MAGKKDAEILNLKDMLNKVWMAGVGALRTAEEEGSKFFDTLVDKGTDFQTSTKDMSKKQLDKIKSILKDSVSSVKDTVDSISTGTTGGGGRGIFDKINLEEFASSILKQLGLATKTDFENLGKKINELEKTIRNLKNS